MSRVETGVVQFGEDWPGVFIRGDNALGYALALEAALEAAALGSALALESRIRVTSRPLMDITQRAQLEGLQKLLASCRAPAQGVVHLELAPPAEPEAAEPDSIGPCDMCRRSDKKRRVFRPLNSIVVLCKQCNKAGRWPTWAIYPSNGYPRWKDGA